MYNYTYSALTALSVPYGPNVSGMPTFHLSLNSAFNFSLLAKVL